MSIPISLNVHLTMPEHAQDVTVEGLGTFVALRLGEHVTVFLRDPAVITALETALAEARTLLQQVGVKA